jgi:PAS domain S-box-containing protein
MQRAVAEGRAVTGVEVEFVLRDGRRIPTVGNVLPLFDSGNKVRGCVAAFVDITEQKHLEENLRRLAIIVESSEDAMITETLDSRFSSWNRGAELVYGYTAEEAIGKDASMIAPPGREHEISAIMARIRRGDAITQFQTKRRRKDGTLIDVSLTISPVRDNSGAVVAAAVVARDVTERIQAEAALVESENRLATILKYLPAGVAVVDTTGHVSVANPMWMRLLGAADPSMDDNGNDKWQACHPDGQPLERQEYPAARALRGEEVVPGIEFLDTGSVQRWTRASAVPLRGPDGRILAALALLQDIDEERRILEALRQSSEELRYANEALLRSNQDLERFTFVASHDLQEPLRMITAFAQLLERDQGEQPGGTTCLYTRNIVQGAERLRELIADLLTYTAIRGDTEAPPEAVNLNHILETVRFNLKASIDETGAVIESDNMPTIHALSSHFLTLFQNLIGNAIKYRSQAAPHIRIGFQQPRLPLPPRAEAAASATAMNGDIAFSGERDEDRLHFTISDNGIGIEPEYHQKIFVAFKRLHGKNIPGTGIGLAICQRVIEQCGGSIWVESEVGKGSTFHFTLPAALTH